MQAVDGIKDQVSHVDEGRRKSVRRKYVLYLIAVDEDATNRGIRYDRHPNVSKKITSIYLTFLSTPELIMMCRVFHLSTFRPPVDNAISCAHCRRQVFLSTVKSNV